MGTGLRMCRDGTRTGGTITASREPPVSIGGHVSLTACTRVKDVRQRSARVMRIGPANVRV
jgi:hypothetical protein